MRGWGVAVSPTQIGSEARHSAVGEEFLVRFRYMTKGLVFRKAPSEGSGPWL